MPDIKTYLILVVLMVVVMSVRAYFASQKSKQDKQAAERSQDRNQLRMREIMGGREADPALSFTSGASAISLDVEKKQVVGVSNSQNLSPIPVADITDVRVFDHSEDYKHSLEMERLHKGVQRSSLYLPFGRHSLREVREGHKEYQNYTGSPVFGLDIIHRGGHVTSIPFYIATGSLFWTEEKELGELRLFADRLRREILRLQ